MNSMIKYLLLLCSLAVTTDISAQNCPIRTNAKPHSYKGRKYEGRKYVTNVRNLTDTAIVVTFTNEYDGKTNYKKEGEPDSKSLGLKAHEKRDIKDGVVYNYVHVRIDDSTEELWEERISTPEERSTAKDKTSNQKTDSKKKTDSNDNPKKKEDPKKKPDVPQPEKKAVALKTVVKDFHAHLDSIPFYCADSITADSATLQKHFDMLSLESVDTKGYIEEQHLNALLSAMTDTIESYKTDTTLIASFLRRYADLYQVMTDAIGQYVTDVKNCDFPNENEQY